MTPECTKLEAETREAIDKKFIATGLRFKEKSGFIYMKCKRGRREKGSVPFFSFY
jgi:hypothetical protein